MADDAEWMSRTYPLIQLGVMGVGWCLSQVPQGKRCCTSQMWNQPHTLTFTPNQKSRLWTQRPARFWIWQVFQRKHVSMIQLLWLPRSRWSQVKPGEARWAFSVLLTPSASDWGCQTCRTTESNPTHTGGLKVWKFYDSHYSEGNVSTQEWKHKESEKFFAHEGFVPV